MAEKVIELVHLQKQFGENTVPLMSFSDPLSSDLATGASPLWQRVKNAVSRRLRP